MRSLSKRSLLISLVALPILAYAPLGSAAAGPMEDGARQFVQGLADRAVGVLQSKAPKAQRDQEFAQILTDGFDVRAIAVFCLGSYWNRATEQERQEYLKLFQDLIVQTYSARLGSVYHGEKLEIGQARPDGNQGVWVSSKILTTKPEDEPIKIDWRVRQPGGKNYKIIDVVVTNVSMVITQRDDFVGILQRNGGNIADFLNMLRDKVNKLQAS
ncbi:MAG: ABC transporter substrate-binding protein [Alphaproteobacteria bacterium]